MINYLINDPENMSVCCILCTQKKTIISNAGIDRKHCTFKQFCIDFLQNTDFYNMPIIFYVAERAIQRVKSKGF